MGGRKEGRKERAEKGLREEGKVPQPVELEEREAGLQEEKSRGRMRRETID